MSPSSGSMFTIGGYNGTKALNDAWRFDSVAGQWSRLISAGSNLSPRVGHSCAMSAGGDALYVFGGSNSWLGSSVYFDLWQLDVSSAPGVWTLVRRQECGRWSHHLARFRPVERITRVHMTSLTVRRI